VARNIVTALSAALRGMPCEPFGSDIRVRIPNGNFRYPAVTIDCGQPADDAIYAADPRVVIEMLSPTTEFFDQADTLAEYQSIPGLAHIVLFAPDRAFARVWTRDGQSWAHTDRDGLEASLALPAVDAVVTFVSVYEGVKLRASPNDAQEAQ
jgi:Uma2 family endonuclease